MDGNDARTTRFNFYLLRIAGVLFCILLSTDSRLAGDDAATIRVGSEEIVLRFRREPQCQSSLVRLGDLVEVLGAGRRVHDELLEVPLAPAPHVGVTQPWTSNDVIRHLELRGLIKKRLRWSGPETASLIRLADVKPKTEPTPLAPAFVQDRTLNQAESNIVQAAREYLWLKTGERTEWRIKVKVPPEHALGLGSRRNIETIGGGEDPWVGEQTLIVGYKYQGKQLQVELPVIVELPPSVVIANRSMRRDEVIDASALAYSPLPERMADQADKYFSDFDQLIGKQLRRSLSTGLPIPIDTVGEPIVVSSGEMVEIESVAGSISVRTGAKALSGGAVGDLINVELLTSRKRLTAMVVGPLQVRVSGTPHVSQAPSSPANQAANADRNRKQSGSARPSGALPPKATRMAALGLEESSGR